jgi:hypothetical protein
MHSSGIAGGEASKFYSSDKNNFMTGKGNNKIYKHTIWGTIIFLSVVIWTIGFRTAGNNLYFEEKALSVDVGIFYSDCGDFEIRAKPSVNFPGTSVTNIQFTIRWPENSVNLFNFSSDFGLMQQGPVYVSGGFQYAIFISVASTSINWITGNEYVLLNFSHDQSGSGYADFDIADDAWTLANNGLCYIEILGLDETGLLYHQANNTWLGNCGKIDAGIFSTDCGDFEVRLKPHDNYPNHVLTNVQFTLSWPAGSVILTDFSSAFDLSQQGPVYTVNDTSYALFLSASAIPVNWTAETEYTVLTFSHDQSGNSYADFLISEAGWTLLNNGVYYVELLGIDKTGNLYHQSENTYIGSCGIIDIGLFSTDCAEFEVRLKPHLDFPDNAVTNIQFTLKWPANTVDLISFASAFGVEQQGPVMVESDTNYAIFISTTGISIDWVAESEYTILTFSHDQSGSGYADVLIDTSLWGFNHNGIYYLELLGLNYTGNVYHNAENTYMGECGKVDVKVILQGPYNYITGLMNTSLNTEGNLPLHQSFNSAPWNYPGTEQVSSFPDSIIDWVMVELRDKNDNTLTIEKRAGLLSKSGIVLDTNMTRGLSFTSAVNPDTYYIVVWHRNHMPVMSGLPVVLPNLGDPYDFTDVVITQPYKHNDPLAAVLELIPAGSGRYGMIAGDINADKRLSYLGSNNDRALIILRITSVSGLPFLNTVISSYFNEDLNLDNKVMYIGSSNDRGIILSNLIKLTGSSNLNAVYNSVVP